MATSRYIMPFSSPDGCHNRVIRMKLKNAGPVMGSPVRMDNAGFAVESTTNAAVNDGFFGIAMAPYVIASKNPETGVNWAANDYIPVVIADHDTWFIGKLTTDSSTTAVPTAATIGDVVGLVKVTIDGVANTWIFSSEAGTTKIARVVDVLDAKRRSLTTRGAGAGVYVVVQFQAAQMQSPTAPVVPAA